MPPTLQLPTPETLSPQYSTPARQHGQIATSRLIPPLSHLPRYLTPPFHYLHTLAVQGSDLGHHREELRNPGHADH